MPFVRAAERSGLAPQADSQAELQLTAGAAPCSSSAVSAQACPQDTWQVVRRDMAPPDALLQLLSKPVRAGSWWGRMAAFWPGLGDWLCRKGWLPAPLQFANPATARGNTFFETIALPPLATGSHPCCKQFCRDALCCSSFVIEMDGQVLTKQDVSAGFLSEKEQLAAVIQAIEQLCDDDADWIYRVTSAANQGAFALHLRANHLDYLSHGDGTQKSWGYWLRREGDAVAIHMYYVGKSLEGELLDPSLAQPIPLEKHTMGLLVGFEVVQRATEQSVDLTASVHGHCQLKPPGSV